MESYDELSSSLKSLPDEGVTMEGATDGRYVVYASVDPEKSAVIPDLKYSIINYSAKAV